MTLTMWRVWARVFVLLVSFSACSALRTDPFTSKFEDSRPQKPVLHSGWEYLKSTPSWIPGSGFLTEKLKDCKESYGLFPCSTSLGGNLFLLLVFVYILLKAADFLSSGCELLLTVLHPGLIGGLVLPILSTVPDSFLIFVSGSSGSAADAQSQVLVGIGLLAGSNIMSLTLLWGGSLLLGRCDLINQGRGGIVAKDRTLTKKWWNLTGTGVTTDQQTQMASRIMSMTVLPYLVAQAPVVLGWADKEGSISVLVGCAVSLIGLASYCAYQVAFPWIQQRWIYIAKEKLRRSIALHRFSQLSFERSWGSLLLADGVTPNTDVICRIFKFFDTNRDDHLSKHELKVLISSLGIEHEGYIPEEDEVMRWLKDFDISKDGLISESEFVDGMEKWVRSFVSRSTVPRRTRSTLQRIEATAPRASNSNVEPYPHIFGIHRDQAEHYLQNLLDYQDDDDGDGDDEDEAQGAPPTKAEVIAKAVVYLIVGTLIAGIVADPLVDAIGNFSTMTGISPFFIAFVATPLATGSSDILTAFSFAKQRRRKKISMTYSQIYGGVTMNNTLSLAVFLAIVYTRGLRWDFSSEVLVILLATAVIGAFTSMRVTFPSWMAMVTLLLYPFSIALVAVLDNVYGWE